MLNQGIDLSEQPPAQRRSNYEPLIGTKHNMITTDFIYSTCDGGTKRINAYQEGMAAADVEAAPKTLMVDLDDEECLR